MLMWSFLLMYGTSVSDVISGKNQFLLVEQVNPFVGTDTVGNTYLGASLPIGTVQLSPDTDNSGWNHRYG